MDKILIADDDAIFLKLLIAALDDYQDRFSVIGVANGQQAIDVLSETKIALLVTDIKMPEVDGLSLLAFMNEYHPAIPCFVMTAYETPELKASLPKDLLRFLSKPFPASKLGPAIIKSLDEKTPRGALQGISVVSFLQMIELEKKTCIFEVKLPDKKGVFYFEKGVMCNAACGDLKGEAAALALITRERGVFHFKPFPKKKLAKKDLDLKSLIEKALQDDGEIAESELSEPESIEIETAETVEDESQTGQPLKEFNLPGVIIYNHDRDRGEMDVINLSIDGLRFRARYKQKYSVGDKVRLEFNLDDGPKSLVTKDAVIREIDGYYAIAAFSEKTHYDKLGPYLHFNKLEAQKLF